MSASLTSQHFSGSVYSTVISPPRPVPPPQHRRPVLFESVIETEMLVRLNKSHLSCSLSLQSLSNKLDSQRLFKQRVFKNLMLYVKNILKRERKLRCKIFPFVSKPACHQESENPQMDHLIRIGQRGKLQRMFHCTAQNTFKWKIQQ